MEIISLIKENLINGDVLRIAERADKSPSAVNKILTGERTAQGWFYENALNYLIDQKRIQIKKL